MFATDFVASVVNRDMMCLNAPHVIVATTSDIPDMAIKRQHRIECHAKQLNGVSKLNDCVGSIYAGHSVYRLQTLASSEYHSSVFVGFSNRLFFRN